MIEDAKKRKIGRELVDWIYLGIRTGARRGVEAYQSQKATDFAGAEEQLKRAANIPLRARARINYARDRYEAINGVGTFNTFIGECLALAGSVTLADLNADLTTLENYANNLIAEKQAGAMTLDQVADDIVANMEKESDDWVFPFPSGYTDQW